MSIHDERAIWAAYQATRFEARVGTETVAIHIGECSADLDAILRRHTHTAWTFITAWNPASATLPADQNMRRNRDLFARLTDDGYVVFEGAGVPADPGWSAEESFLALGVSHGNAIHLGRAFGQNAVVWGALGGPAELLDCRPI